MTIRPSTYLHAGAGPSKGPSTYLHAGAGGCWPVKHSTEDTFAGIIVDAPNKGQPTMSYVPDVQYSAEFDTSGKALLVLKRTLGSFDTFADAQLAAKALNNHTGS